MSVVIFEIEGKADDFSKWRVRVGSRQRAQSPGPGRNHRVTQGSVERLATKAALTRSPKAYLKLSTSLLLPSHCINRYPCLAKITTTQHEDPRIPIRRPIQLRSPCTPRREPRETPHHAPKTHKRRHGAQRSNPLSPLPSLLHKVTLTKPLFSS